MINKLFYSNNNKNAIKYIINENIEKNLNVKLNNNFDMMINDTMDYVLSQVSKEPPKGMQTEEYIFLMNKKVYELILPVIKTNIEKNKLKKNISNQNISNQNISNQIPIENNKLNNSIQNNIFDPLLLKNFEQPSVMEYPKPSIHKNNNENIDTKIKSLENERSTLTPKIRPIDFTLKDDEPNKNTVQMYNELLTTYNTQVNSMSSFDTNQKKINEKIEKIEENELLNYNNNQSFTPIDLLQNKNESKNFFGINDIESNGINSILKDINNNVAYNRNDVETFINNDNENNIINNKLNNLEYLLNENKNSSKYSEINIQENTGPKFSNVNSIGSTVLINEPKMNIIEKKFILTIDSVDRDLYEYPLQTYFQVKLAPAGNNLLYNTYYDEYNTLILYEKTISYGDGNNSSINETFDNIRSIKLTSVNVPNSIIYVGGLYTDTNNVTNIFKESYTYLVIPELRGPYKSNNTLSNNAFAKLIIPTGSNGLEHSAIVQTYFTLLTTSNDSEYFIYDPILNGKMDKMTLNFVNKNGKLFNFGIDKLYVEKIMEGTYKYNGNCGEKYLTTKLLIQNKNDEYRKYCNAYYPNNNSCNYLNSNPLIPTDLIYFYYTRPSYDQIIYLEDYVNISKMTYDFTNKKLKISASYLKKMENNEMKNIQINFKDIIPGGIDNNPLIYNNYYIILYDKKTTKYYYLKVDSFSGKSIVVIYKKNEKMHLSEYKHIRIGISKSNLRGTNNDDNQSLFCNSGYYVLDKGNSPSENNNDSINDDIITLNIDNTSFLIEINYPYNLLPDYIKDNNKYIPGEIFLIQDKMQISYTFEITSMIKDYSIVSSNLNESGNN
jgi:hypothetical protein